MVDSVSGSQRQTPVEVHQEQVQADKAEASEKVSAGYDRSNSVSHRTGGGYVQLPPGSEAELPPTIPGPNFDVTASQDDIGSLRVNSLTSQARSSLTSSIELLERTQPELVTPELAAHVREIEGRLSAIESAPEGQLKSIQATTASLNEQALAGTLDADKLQQIMMELETKLADNSVKYSEIELNSKAAEAERTASNNIKDIREHIEKSNDSKDSKALFGLKIALCFLCPPAGIWEAAQALGREITGTEQGPSMFSPTQAKSEHITWGLGFNPDTGKPATDEDYHQRDLEKNGQGTEPDSAPDTTGSKKPVDTTFQGLDIAQGGLSQVEMMKLLQKLQQSEENKEKLQEAIAALESGDPKAAAEILGGLADQLGMDSSLGDNTTTNTGLGQQPAPQEASIPEQPPSTPPKEPEKAPLTPNQQLEAREEASELLERLGEVSERTLSAEETSIRQQSLIARHSRRA